MRGKIIIFSLILFGIFLRIDVFDKLHLDTDEFYQLKSIQESKPFWKNDQTYGDHTSFPGEYILHHRIVEIIPAKPDIDLQSMKVKNYPKYYKWVLAIPHIIFFLFSILLFYILCELLTISTQAKIVTWIIFLFNHHIIYYSISFRPYSMLITFTLWNLAAAIFYFKDENKEIPLWVYPIIFFITSAYHAYGLLISVVCFLFGWMNYKKKIGLEMWITIILSTLLWGYYASWNTWGIKPNAVQSIVDPFQFMPRNDFLFSLLMNLLSASELLAMCFLPLIILGFIIKCGREDINFLNILIALPLAAIILVDIKTQYWIHPRQFVWIMPLWAIFCGKMIDNLTSTFWKNQEKNLTT